MARLEFSRKTKQAALARSGLKCEAAGPMYGFDDGQRCNCSLTLGVQFDHVLPCELGGDNSLENALAICCQCHKYKTRDDIRRIRKSDRQRDKKNGLIRPKGAIKGQGFPTRAKPEKTSRRASLQPRKLYQKDFD